MPSWTKSAPEIRVGKRARCVFAPRLNRVAWGRCDHGTDPEPGFLNKHGRGGRKAQEPSRHWSSFHSSLLLNYCCVVHLTGRIGHVLVVGCGL